VGAGVPRIDATVLGRTESHLKVVALVALAAGAVSAIGAVLGTAVALVPAPLALDGNWALIAVAYVALHSHTHLQGGHHGRSTVLAGHLRACGHHQQGQHDVLK
jgi:hypothetical protein